ncbi:hypothetical protein V2J09_004907 [Rumex salicifolius]
MDPGSARNTQSNKFKSKKRFSDEQIRSLESMFNTETRPESQIKNQIADQLGLNPNQVGIWFQNRRARCKSKQIEQDYRLLKASYDDLASRFEALKREHHCLINELQRLRGAVKGSNGTSKIGLSTELCVGEERNLGKDLKEDKNQAEVLNMIEPSCSSPLSSGNCHNLESILEPDYLINDNSGLEWWETY